MHFSRILWDMAKKDQAFLVNTVKQTLVIVPSGKYAGVWRYHKASRKTTWEMVWLCDLIPMQIRNRDGKVVTFPLPTTVYGTYAAKHPGKLHREFRKELGYATLNWKRINDSKVNDLRSLSETISNHIDEGNYQTKLGVGLACMFALPVMLRLAAGSKELAREKARLIHSCCSLLGGMKPSQRQRFIIRLLTRKFDSALSLSFRKANKTLIEEATKRLPLYFPQASILLRSDFGPLEMKECEELIGLTGLFTTMKVKRLNVGTWTSD